MNVEVWQALSASVQREVTEYTHLRLDVAAAYAESTLQHGMPHMIFCPSASISAAQPTQRPFTVHRIATVVK